MDKGNKGIEPLRDSQASAEGSDFGDLIEDDKDKGVGDTIELIVERKVGVDSAIGLHFLSIYFDNNSIKQYNLLISWKGIFKTFSYEIRTKKIPKNREKNLTEIKREGERREKYL